MVKTFLFCSLLLVVGSMYAAKVVSFPDIFKPLQLVIDDGTLYISDQNSILIYSMENFKLLQKIGGKGNGPGEFQKTPYVKVLQDEILAHSTLKFCRFTKEGKLLMEKRFSTTMLFNIYPVGQNYIIDVSSFNKEAQAVREINIVDQNLEKIKSLYTHIRKPKNSGGKRIIQLIKPFASFTCSADKIFLANSHKGFSIEIFDLNGKPIRVINRPFSKISIPENYKKKRKEEFLRGFSPNMLNRIKKRIEFDFPEYFPAIKSFIVSDDKIYVKTYGPNNKKDEYTISDFKGNFLKKVFLPGTPFTRSTIYNNKFYFLKDNDAEEEWELHCLDIK